MQYRTRLLTATIATTGLLMLPVASLAQTTSSTQSPTSQSGTSRAQSPTYYLDQARQVLDRLDSSSTSSVTGTSGSSTGSTRSASDQQILSDIRTHFDALRSSFNGVSSDGSGSTSGSGMESTGSTGSSSSTGSDNWKSHYVQIEQILDRVNVPKSTAWVPVTGTGIGISGEWSASGSGSTSGSGTTGSGMTGSSTSGTSGSSAIGSSGSTGTSSSSQSLDPSVVTQLTEFRRNIENFYQVASTGGTGREASAGSSYDQVGTSGSTVSTGAMTGSSGTPARTDPQ